MTVTRSSFLSLILLLGLMPFGPLLAQDFSAEEGRVLINGQWKINEALSDVTDDQVEAAIKRAGGKVNRRWFKGGNKEYYRGGPADQEMYDRISYDTVLAISYQEPEFRFVYADDFTRIFHSDGRRRRTGVNSFFEQGAGDFSFAEWNSIALLVEARPRDGGFTMETYTLEANGQRLRVVMHIEPRAFGAAIALTRVYDRVAAATPRN
jgi:hypothetical protein